MKLFKNYTYAWWQMGIFKVCLLSLGALIGAYWSSFFFEHIRVFLSIVIVFGVYLALISFQEHHK